MRRLARILTCALLLTAAAALPAPAATSVHGPLAAPALRVKMAPLKLREARLLAEEPMRERRAQLAFAARAKALRRLARTLRHAPSPTALPRGERLRPALAPGDALARDARARRDAAPATARIANALAPNVRCNDPSGDLPSPYVSMNVITEGQCETAIARWNDLLVAAWNDGKGYDDGSGQTLGWGTSVDGGATWIDQGTFPLPPAFSAWVWSSDPVLTVNPVTGAFYFAGLGSVPGSFTSVGVCKGRFSGGGFTWERITASRAGAWSTDAFDKSWLAIDPADGRVYLSYTDFKLAGSEIDFQSADSALTSWSAAQRLSDDAEVGRVQGSRPAVGPDGSVYVVYYLVGPQDLDFLRIASSSDRGASFTPTRDAISFYPDFGSGSPGFNRPFGIQFPSIAVDRSGHSHDGRLYLSWAESLNWFDDVANIGAAGTTVGEEPDDSAAVATPAAAGQVIRGFGEDNHDLDYFAIPLQAGQTMIAEVDSLENGQAITLRMFAPDGVTGLAYLQAVSRDVLSGLRPAWIASAPVTGTYYLRVATVNSFGWYKLRTGLASNSGERGRDQRDVFVAWSDDHGNTWSTPVRVNHDAPGFDDWLPEVAVAPNGQVACAWYDWRAGPASAGGGQSTIELATSGDGGTTWVEQGAVTDAITPWSSVLSNVIPNQGDYLSIHADAQGYALAWGDGRGGNPDVYMAAVPPIPASVGPAAAAGFDLAIAGGVVRDAAHFSFHLPGPTRARLAILDLQGRRIRTLLDAPLGPGAHALDWDLRDEVGARARPGVYWARLEAGERRAAGKVIVLK
jgi:hypothetical protein